MTGSQASEQGRLQQCRDILIDLIAWQAGEALYGLKARVADALGHPVVLNPDDPPEIQRERLIDAMEEMLELP